MDAPKVEMFLSYLANERQVSESTHWQALSVILFLYKVVLQQDLPWLDGIGKPQLRDSDRRTVLPSRSAL
jgi:hypothetical protein